MKRWIDLNEDKSENIPYGHTEYPFYILHTFLSEYPNYAAPVLHNNNIPYIKLTDSGWHRDIIRGIREIYRLRDTATAPLKIQGIFSWIWASVYENMPGADSEEQPYSSDLSILKNMTGFIQQHYHEKISLSQIASAGGIGQSKCCKLFRVYFHQTSNTYLTAYRLNRSVELLRTTGRSITEVAYAAGFNGASYYAETFRKWFHISPSEYRGNLET